MNSPSHLNVLIVSYGGCRSCPWCCTRSALPLVYCRASYNPGRDSSPLAPRLHFRFAQSIIIFVCLTRCQIPGQALLLELFHPLCGCIHRCLTCGCFTGRKIDVYLRSELGDSTTSASGQAVTRQNTHKKRHISVKERPRCCCFCVFPRHCVKTKRNKA